MTPASVRGHGASVAALGLVLADAAIRLAAGGPYPGATALLIVACGLALLPVLPGALAAPAIQVALLPALGLGSYMVTVTTISVLGVELGELSLRLAVAALVVLVSAASIRFGLAARRESPPGNVSRAREAAVIAGVSLVALYSFASAYDIVDPFPPPGTDWTYYLLYAEEVEAQGTLTADDPYTVGAPRSMGHYPGIGALYGGARMLDDAGSTTLSLGIALVSALTVLSVFAAVAGLWGPLAGLLAASAYAVSPIRLEPMYWHGLATVLALVFVPLVVLALGLIFRGSRDVRVSGLLAFALVGTLVAHSPSAFAVAIFVAVSVVAAVLVQLLRARSDAALRTWRGPASSVLAGVAIAAVLGLGVVAHFVVHSRGLGPPVSFRFYDSHWLDRDTLDFYFSWELLALALASLLVIAVGPVRRRDPALGAIAALVLSALLVTQLWRIEVPFEYRRAVYYAGPALVALIGVASFGLARRRLWAWLAVCGLTFVVVAQSSVGLRLPERLLRGDDVRRSAELDALAAFGDRLDRADPDRTAVLVADRCLSMRVAFVLRRRTLIEAEPWQAGYRNLLPIARDASAIVAGGAEGRRKAAERGVDYVLVDPRCGGAPRGAKEIYSAPELLVSEL